MINNTIQTSKTCSNCGEIFSVGRIDKKFCTDACRVDFNNKIKLEKRIALPDFVRTIPKIILSNYRIMRKLNTTGTTKVSKEKLDALGFNFRYITSYQTTKKGDTYHFCFDQGYLRLKDNQVLLVTQQNQVDTD
ncbi:hypothetical protein [Pedobacter nyackensis]|uniref:hypothetical protein n=1 Tax=Pedobacter nyackensis TaxID=475255 RepID=UPI00292D07AD|nr:hypothetical protein [Pedobacter nyackensis]